MHLTKSRIISISWCILTWLTISPVMSQTEPRDLRFTHFTIDQPLPGEGWGTGGFTLADYDQDGDLDITLQRRSDSTVYWYAYEDDGHWVRHTAGRLGGGQLGATCTDVDRDGDVDLIMGRAWLENPGMLYKSPDQPWTVHYYDGGLPRENHDIVLCDIDQDGSLELICYAQESGIIRSYDFDNPFKWTYQDIARGVNTKDVHAGFAPGGIGDLNGDELPDILMPFYWYENPGNSNDLWPKHSWPYKEKQNIPYGSSFRSVIRDLDNDGDHDFIIADCDMGNSSAYWYENKGEDHMPSFVEHELPLPEGTTGSFHSLAVGDFNLDGLTDIFLGEQEDRAPATMKPAGHKERGLLMINTGSDASPRFRTHIIHEDNPGWHDTIAGDVDGDGDLDLVSKIWSADEGGIWHADFWRNDLISN